ncbi:MAG: hypothetical protein AAF564_22900 [Bacteroidota bacterium]
MRSQYLIFAGLLLSSCASQQTVLTSSIAANTIAEQLAIGNGTLHLVDGSVTSIASIAVRDDSLRYQTTENDTWSSAPVATVDRLGVRYRKSPRSSISAFFVSTGAGAGIGYVLTAEARQDVPLGLGSILTNLFTLAGASAGALIGSLISSAPRLQYYILRQNDHNQWVFVKDYRSP